MAGDDLYLLHRTAIEEAIRAVCWRQRLSAVDAEDFAGLVRLHLIDRDFEVLRRFQRRSSLGTYLLTVITHLCHDWRIARWGKWRPSAGAQRLGPVGIHLERLTTRDGLSFEEACETLRTNFRVTESRERLEAMASTLRSHGVRRQASDDGLDRAVALDPQPDVRLEQAETARHARAALALLTAALQSLPAQDQLILKLRYADGLKIGDIARMLGLEAKPLYRRLERLLTVLRSHLEREGLSAETARALLAGEGFEQGLDDGGESSPRVRLFKAGGRPQVPEGSAQ